MEILKLIEKLYPTFSLIALLVIIALFVYSLLYKKGKNILGAKKDFVVWGSLICSLVALCRSYPIPSSFDYTGLIVGVLSLLVTVLIGWNIYSVIDTKSIIKKHEILKRKTTNEINKLRNLINDQEQEKEKLRNYVNTVQNFTMANIRMTENKYGDALGIYCNAAINMYEIVKRDYNKTDDEQDLMNKSIRNAYNIVVNKDKTIKDSQLLTNMHSNILKGLKDVRTQEILSGQIQAIIKAIEDNYISDRKLQL